MMNERIKELAVEAKLPSYVLEYGTELCLAPHLEKFAELLLKDAFAIIKEAVLEGDESHMDDLLDVRLGDGAADVVDAYGIVERIY